MSTILIKDSLRQSVEAASGGLQTVLYTAKGQPTYMNIVEKFNLSTINSTLAGTHPAFIVNGVEKDKIFIGTYEGVVKNGELLSLPNQSPTSAIALDTAISAVRTNGAGHHLITNAEYSALALLTYANATQPLGNSYFGRASEDVTQFGRRVDGLSATTGIATGSPQILTGSGPVKFRHNQRYNGISDLAGNLATWTTGVRNFKGELQIIANNDAAIASTDLSSASAAWKAIDATTGALVAPDGSGTTAGTVKLALNGTANYTLVLDRWSAFGSMTNPGTTPVSVTALNLLKSLGLFPITSTASDLGLDGAAIANTTQTEGYLLRGGYYSQASVAGVFSFNLSPLRTDAGLYFGTRPAYYTP